MSQRKFSLFPESAHERDSFLGAFQSAACCRSEVREVFGAEIGHGVTLPVTPDVLGRIQFWGIWRKSRKKDSTALSTKEFSDFPAAMNWKSVPNDEQPSPDLTTQMMEEVEYLRRADCARIEPKVELPPSNTGNDGELLPIEVKLQLRCLTPGCPCSADVRALRDSTLIYKDDGSAFSEGFFLRAGHLYRFQRRMASSSRSMALPEGRWQLHPRIRSNLQTCPGWYVTPHVLPMASAIRGSVQRPLLYPCASGPSSKTRCIFTRCPSLSLGLRPVRPAERRPAMPFPFRARAHRDTDISLTPNWRETSAWLRPLRKSTAASFRRCSRVRMALPSRFIPFGFPMPTKLSEKERSV